MIEPLVQGAAGMIVQPPGYLRRMREICDRHEVLLICDEVATGFGRTGTMFAVEQEGVRPDILTVAKGLTGGYLPLAATLTTEEVFDAFLGPVRVAPDLLPRPHLHREPARLRRRDGQPAPLPGPRTSSPGSRPRPTALARALAPLADHPHVGEIRRRGLMVGIELVRDRATKEEYPFELRAGPPGDARGPATRGHPPPARERGGAHAAAGHDRGAARRARANHLRVDRRGGGAGSGARTLRHRDRHRRRQDRGGRGARRRVAGPRARRGGHEAGPVGGRGRAAHRRRPAARRPPGGPIPPGSSARTRSARRSRRRWRRASPGWRSRSTTCSPARPELARRHAALVVEGAGGLLVPLTESHTYADLAVALGMPVLVVARAGLGHGEPRRAHLRGAARPGPRRRPAWCSTGPRRPPIPPSRTTPPRSSDSPARACWPRSRTSPIRVRADA